MPSHKSERLEEMVWPEVESALENGTRTAIVAVGSIEQHGPHLPLNMDTLDGDELSHTELHQNWAMPSPPRRFVPGVPAITWSFPARLPFRPRR